MKKKFKLEDLDCANCAAKMTIDAEDERFEEIMDEVVKTCAKVEPDCRILR